MSERTLARIAGALYLAVIATGLVADFYVRSGLIVDDNPAATAHNIVAHSALYRLGFCADLLMLVCDVGVVAIFYRLFRPVSPLLALLTTALRLSADAVLAANLVLGYAPLVLLGASPYLQGLGHDQLAASALLILDLHETAEVINMAIFGFYCLFFGKLITMAGFIPRILGVLLVIAGWCYLIFTFSHFLDLKFGGQLVPFIFMPGLLAEASLAFWLAIVGLDITRWKAKAEM